MSNNEYEKEQKPNVGNEIYLLCCKRSQNWDFESKLHTNQSFSCTLQTPQDAKMGKTPIQPNITKRYKNTINVATSYKTMTKT